MPTALGLLMDCGPAYGRAYSLAIPGSRFELIERVGHHPEIEQPDAFVRRVAAFVSR